MSRDGGWFSHDEAKTSVRIGHRHSLVDVEPPPRLPSVVKLACHGLQRGSSRTCEENKASELVWNPCRRHEIIV